MTSPLSRRPRRGFTFIEILTVFVLFACVTAIGLVPPPSKEFSDMNFVAGTAGQRAGQTGGGHNPLHRLHQPAGRFLR